MIPAEPSPFDSGKLGGGGGIDILLVEDEEAVAAALCYRLERANHHCVPVGSLAQARRALAEKDFGIMLLDLRLPDGHGLEFLKELAERSVDMPVLVLTSFSSVEDAVTAIKLGAVDYLVKPDDPDEALLAVEKALNAADHARRLGYARERESHALEGTELLGESEQIAEVRATIRRMATLRGGGGEQPPTVLIEGETGTGKSLAAQLLHRWGPFPERPFVQIDCAALPGNLIESELFGHEKGAFTQAVRTRTGLIEAAEDGTVFLDEIGELTLDLQTKLLTVLDRREVRRVGSSRERKVEAHFVAATNRDLQTMVDEGRFRADLYYRLNVLRLRLPTLREIPADLPLLVRHFADDTARHYGLPVPEITAEAMDALLAYPWPGNVRELKHLLDRAILLAQTGPLTPERLAIGRPLPLKAAGEATGDLSLDGAERRLIRRALELSRGNVSHAARLLEIGRGALRARMAKHGIRAEE